MKCVCTPYTCLQPEAGLRDTFVSLRIVCRYGRSISLLAASLESDMLEIDLRDRKHIWWRIYTDSVATHSMLIINRKHLGFHMLMQSFCRVVFGLSVVTQVHQRELVGTKFSKSSVNFFETTSVKCWLNFKNLNEISPEKYLITVKSDRNSEPCSWTCTEEILVSDCLGCL